MEETKQREPVYSDERTEIATVGSPQEETKAERQLDALLAPDKSGTRKLMS